MKKIKFRIRRTRRQHGLAQYVRGFAAICVLAMMAPIVAPLAASRTPFALSITLDPPLPYDASAGPMGWRGIAPGMALSQGQQPQTPGFSPTLLVPGAAAMPFQAGGSAQDRLRASLCLTAAIYYEAGNEPDEGQRAVAQVVLNRVRHPAYPNTICGVVYQGTERNDTLCQFTFGCDGSMARMPVLSVWGRARRNAQAALSGAVYAPVGLATHYHTLAVNPVWNKALTPTSIVGAHIFFRWPGGAGSPKAFYASYRGNEPIPAPKPALHASAAALEPAGPPLPVPQDWAGAALFPAQAASVAPNQSVAADRRYVTGSLPESEIREEYRHSGQWVTR